MRSVAAGAGVVSLCLTVVSVGAAELPTPAPPVDNQKLAHDILRDLVAVRSVHEVGTREAAAVMVRYLKAGGFSDAEIQVLAEEKYPNQVNVVVRLKGAGKGRPILWNGHLDVVEAKPEDWSVPPFRLTEKDGYFYGRGTTDMKNQDAAIAAALIRLRQEQFVPDRDVIAAFTADEESVPEQNGMDYLVREHRRLVDAQIAVNADGPYAQIQNGKRLEFGVETSQKTYVTFRLETTNRGGHSSEPRPDNAIYELALALGRVQQFEFPYRTNATTRGYFAKTAELQSGETRADMLALAAPDFDVAAARRLAENPSIGAMLHSTCVATMLSGGHQENALPQRADATVQCRIMPDETEEQTRAALEKAIGDPGVSITSTIKVVPSPESPLDPALMRAVEQVVDSMWPHVPVVPTMSVGASDSMFTGRAGIASYGISGAWVDIDDDRAHGRDEREAVDRFYSSVEFTYRLMQTLSRASWR